MLTFGSKTFILYLSNMERSEAMNLKFSENIRGKRIQIGYTQSEVATKIGVKRLTYARYELGTREPRLELLPEIARALSCSIDDLFDGVDTKASAQTLLPCAQAPETPSQENAERDLDDLLEW